MNDFTETRLIKFMLSRGFTKFTTDEAVEYILDEIERLERIILIILSSSYTGKVD